MNLFVEADASLLRKFSGEMREWALDPSRESIRGSCLRILLLGEGKDAIPFVENLLREATTSPSDRRIMLAGVALVVHSAGLPWQIRPPLTATDRKQWDAFLKRFIAEERDPDIFWQADRLMCGSVEDWRFSEERFALLEQRAREQENANPEQAARFRRGVAAGRRALEKGETNMVMRWQQQYHPLPKVFHVVTNALTAGPTAEELRQSLPDAERRQ